MGNNVKLIKAGGDKVNPSVDRTKRVETTSESLSQLSIWEAMWRALVGNKRSSQENSCRQAREEFRGLFK